MSSKVMPSDVEPPSYADATSSQYSGPSNYQTQYSAPVQPSAPPPYSMHESGHSTNDPVYPPATYIAPSEMPYRNTVPGSQPYNNTVPGSQEAYETVVLGSYGTNLPTHPIQTTCFHCQESVTTYTAKGLGSAAKCLCCVLTIWGMCWLVLCCDGYKDTVHYCPRCKKELGRYEVWNQRPVHYVAPVSNTITRG